MAGELIEASNEIQPYLEKLWARQIHERIREHEIRIDWLLAYPEYDSQGIPKGPAIKFQGYAARGVCKILGYREQVKGNGDAEITIDGEWWEDHTTTDDQRLALLDHELTHLVIDESERDQAGRPKMLMRKHDFQVGWFLDVAARWGAASGEVEQAQVLKRPEVEQLLFSFEAEAFARPKKTPQEIPGVIITGQFGATKGGRSKKRGRA